MIKYEKGQWLQHTEPGQELFLIVVEDPEKSIFSGWDCKGVPFENEWVFIGERIKPVENLPKKYIEILNSRLQLELELKS